MVPPHNYALFDVIADYVYTVSVDVEHTHENEVMTRAAKALLITIGNKTLLLLRNHHIHLCPHL